jgi:2-alkenal reductase
MSENQTNPHYHLIEHDSKPKSVRKISPKVWLAAMLALTLVLGAFYAPVLWQSLPVNAAAGANFQQAQTLPVDATMLKDQEALSQLYEQVAPSVVSIQVTSPADTSSQGFQFPGIPGIPGFPGLPNQPDTPQGQAPQQRGEGSGFIFDNDGHIVTNNHVVDGAQEINVIFNTGEWAPATVVATDPQADLAVIKVTPPNGFDWRPLPMAAADSLKVGYTVLAMGNPFGLENTMTVGLVSALGRGMPVGDLGNSTYTLPDVIQTDAAINPGNSGGPLINLAGEVVGVNFAIESATRSNSGVGFTIPVAIVNRVVPALIKDGKFEYAYLVLAGASIGPDEAKALNLSNDTLGIYVNTVVPNGPSDQAGVHGADQRASTGGNSNGLLPGGDIITAIDNQPVRRFEDLVSYLVTKAAPGQKVTLSILRDGKTMNVDVVLGKRPSADTTSATQTEGPVSARQAIDIAVTAVSDTLNGQIVQRTVSPDTRNGQAVWVVELGTDSHKLRWWSRVTRVKFWK